MAITDLPLFSMLRTRMHWHQERQRVLAENVSNANTPELPAARSGAAAIGIPAEHYKAVAEVIGYIMKLKRAVTRN